jgi:hypothetical protein
MITTSQPCYRNVFGVDVESSTTRDNSAKRRMRDAMYSLVAAAFARNGITSADHAPLIDSGDGIVALLHPADRVPKTLLLQGVVPALHRLIEEHNTSRPADRLRLRAVLHAGEVHHDTRAHFGETIDVAFRLLDSPVTKRALRRTTAPLVLAISDDIYQSVVRHRYDGIDPLAYSGFVTRRNQSTWDYGWLHVPGEPVTPLVPAVVADPRATAEPKG